MLRSAHLHLFLRRWLCASIIMGAIPACTSTTETRQSTSYAYTGRDSAGVVIVTGVITILTSDSVSYHGTWQLAAAARVADSVIGPQVGSGTWLGTRHDTVLTAGLNPFNADNNVDLVGNFRVTEYRGTWTWNTFRGPSNHGIFSAVQQ